MNFGKGVFQPLRGVHFDKQRAFSMSHRFRSVVCTFSEIDQYFNHSHIHSFSRSNRSCLTPFSFLCCPGSSASSRLSTGSALFTSAVDNGLTEELNALRWLFTPPRCWSQFGRFLFDFTLKFWSNLRKVRQSERHGRWVENILLCCLSGSFCRRVTSENFS